jgi:hypothetical protein
MQQGKSLTASLASSSTSWVLANDIAGLKEVLQGFVGLPDLERAYILSLRGEVLSSTQPDEAGLLFPTRKIKNYSVPRQKPKYYWPIPIKLMLLHR